MSVVVSRIPGSQGRFAHHFSTGIGLYNDDCHGSMGTWPTSGGPDLSDCIAQPRIWSSRSVKPEVVAAVDEPGLGDFAWSDMATVGRTKFRYDG